MAVASMTAITPTATSTDNSDTAAVNQQSTSALANARRNFNYLVSPSASSPNRPKRFRTRALLRTLRYLSQFIFWRLVRWAKYAAVGAAVAAIGATAVGSVVTGVAWIAAPPTITTGIFASVVWGVGKYLARRVQRKWEATGKDRGVEMREREEDEESERRERERATMERRAERMPW